jgi:peptidoglycan/xylan/chitin deacetylase (PgdA/CDA1 family)
LSVNFAPPTNISYNPLSPDAVAAADLNRDGKSDLITTVGNFGSPTGHGYVTVQLGNGDGTFQSEQTYLTGYQPTALALADFNGDGKLDVATAGANGKVSVLLGDGSGGFGPETDYLGNVLGGSLSIATGDFNGDGKLDIVDGSLGSAIGVILGNGDGTFQAPMSYSVGAGVVLAVATGDFNNDGKLDVAASVEENNANTYAVRMMLGNGDGTFIMGGNYVLADGVTQFADNSDSIATGDFNNDGNLDIVTANRGNHFVPGIGGVNDDDVSVLLGNGNCTFQSAVTYYVGPRPWSVAVADLDGDGKLDVVTANQDDTNGVPVSDACVLIGNGDGTFQAHQTFALDPTTYPNSVCVSDFNGDGLPDLATADDTASVSVFLQIPSNTAPTANAGGPYIIHEGESLTLDASASTDLDGDPLTYSWDVNGDGVYGDATGVKPKLTWAQLQALGIDDGPSTWSVKVKVSDGINPPVTSAAATLSLIDTVPTATLSNNGPINEGSQATLSFGSPFDPSSADTAAGFHYSYALSMAGLVGSYATATDGASTSFTFDDGPSSPTVYGRIFDKDGGSSDYSTVVTVNNLVPTATLSNNGPVNEGDPATISFTGQFDPSSADTMAGFHYSYALSMAGLASSYAAATDGASKSFTFDDGPSSPTVYGRIFDKDGGSSDYSTVVTVNNVAPTATLSNYGPVNEGSPATISFTGQFDPSSADTMASFHYTYALSMAGLASSYAAATDGASKSFIFDDGPSSPTVYGRIFDKDGGSSDYSTVVTVYNVAPTASLSNNGPVNEGSAATISFSNQFDPSNADTMAGFHYSYALSLAGLAGTYAAATYGASKSFTFDDGPSSPTVYGRIFDKDGGSSDYSTVVTVYNVAPTASLSNNGPINEGSAATISFSNQFDPSSADTMAGFHYSYALSLAGLATAYAAATDGASKSFTFDDGPSTPTVYGRIFDKDGGYSDYSTVVTVNNVAPTATLSNNGPVIEGSPATISFTGQFDPSSADTTAGFHYTYALSMAGLAATYAAATDGASKSFTFDDGPSSPTVYGRIFDKDGGYSDYSTVVTVYNVAPTATLSNNGPVNEGSPATISFSSQFDPSNADTMAEFHYSYALSMAGLASSYAAATDGASKSFTFDDGPSTPTVYGRIFDKDGGFSDYSTVVTVKNVAPTASVSGPSGGVPGQPRTFTVAAIDPSAADKTAGFTYRITWGDGTAAQTIAQAPGNAAGVSLDHVYTATGTYIVQVTATDKDAGTGGAASASVTVQTVQMQGGSLAVGGTLGNDKITISPANASGAVNVMAALSGAKSAKSLGNFTPSDHILVYGQSGNDTITLTTKKIGKGVSSITVPAFLYGGGTGTVTLDARGSTADNVLTGGRGTNTLYGGASRDLLIAGLGTSILNAGSTDDILIGGWTDYDLTSTAMTYDQKIRALEAVMAEWGSADDYPTRVNALTQGGGLNGSIALNAQTAHENGHADTLNGASSPALDWFLAGAIDLVKNKRSDEIQTTL